MTHRWLYRIFDCMDEVDEAHVSRLLPLCPKSRQDQAMQFKYVFGQYACLRSYVLLEELLEQWGGGVGQPFCYTPQGKPYFAQGPFFNISHCRQGIAVAVSDVPIGIDIESIRTIDDSLIRYTMNSAEQDLIRQSADPNRMFIRLWTQKEAVLKMLGTGINDRMQQVLDDTSSILLHTIDSDQKSYVISVALQR